MKEEIKQCPFCGMTHEELWAEQDDHDGWSIQCYRCNAEGPYCKTKEQAIERWNTRSENKF